ncbi:NAD-dependent epimerase/dehydratase family protein [Cryptosporangium sp. NPDC051539]|uniref:NAD-dependent epimerase/dehydratase family protein n=1 Tax=Cryptosporangium sp. NPDC051539 TaxID=3363962 RepID=UPI0037A0A749
MRTLVTGGSGYLGRPVVDALLAAGHHVTVVSRRDASCRPGVRHLRGDVRDRARVHDIVTDGRFDAVCHFAAAVKGRDSFADPLTYFDVNVAGTLNLLRALRDAGSPARFVFASTDKVYGSSRSGAVDETVPPAPESPYAESKTSAEQLIAAQARTGAIGAVTLRCFNLAGTAGGVPDDDPDRIIPNAFRAATGVRSHVTLNGDGSAVRDFVHVLDVTDAVVLALDAVRPGRSHTYNIGSGVATSMAEIVAAVEEVTGLPVPVVRAPAQPEPQALIADVGLAREHLGWSPGRSDLTAMLREAWQAWPRP